MPCVIWNILASIGLRLVHNLVFFEVCVIPMFMSMCVLIIYLLFIFIVYVYVYLFLFIFLFVLYTIISAGKNGLSGSRNECKKMDIIRLSWFRAEHVSFKILDCPSVSQMICPRLPMTFPIKIYFNILNFDKSIVT